MTEHVIIRLGTQAQSAVHWLVWDTEQACVQASGTLSNATELGSLGERVGQRPITVLVSTAAVSLLSAQVPARNRRQAMAALPYALEDQLAADPDHLFIAPLAQEGQDWRVAVVAHEQMHTWLSWLDDAGLVIARVLPDVVALPDTDDWHLVRLGDDILVRTGHWGGTVVAASLWQQWLPLLIQSEGEPEHLVLHSADMPLPDLAATTQQDLPELPLAALAEGAIHLDANLLTGPYQRKAPKPPSSVNWWWPVGLAASILIAVWVQAGVTWWQYHRANAQLDQAITQVWQTAFPNEPTRNPQVSMRQKLTEQGVSTGQSVAVLPLLQQIIPAFEAAQGMRLQSLRYDGRRQELRVQAEANGFQQFERFKQAVPQPLTVEQGALNKNGDRVSGTLTIRQAG